MTDKECSKCIHKAVCKTAESCDGRVPNCEHFKEGWISVKDRLPTREDANETESVLAINKDEGYVSRWVWDIVVRYPTEFTNWMPLPQPPKGE